MSGLAEDISELLKQAMGLTERTLGPIMASSLQAIFDDIVAICEEEEKQQQVLVNMMNDKEDETEDEYT